MVMADALGEATTLIDRIFEHSDSVQLTTESLFLTIRLSR